MRDAILIGSLLAVVVLFVFLRNLRITMVAAVSLPLTVIGTFFLCEAPRRHPQSDVAGRAGDRHRPGDR